MTRIDLGRYQERRTGLAARFLGGRRPDGEAGWALAPEDAFWALLLHELFDRDVPTVRRMDALAELAASLPGGTSVPDDVRALLPDGTGPEEVVAMAARRDVVALEQLGRRMRRQGRSPATWVRTIRSRIIRRVDRLDPPLVRHGMTVAVLGPDGAGKSTLGGSVAAGGPLPTRTVYLGLFGGRASRRARRARIPGLGFAGRLSRMWSGWLVARWHVVRGRVVLLDRHPSEARMPPPGGRRASIGRRLLGRSVPLPDVVVVLDAPAATLVERKPEHPLATIEAMRAGYLQLAAILPGRVIDAARPADAVANAVTAAAWQRWVEMSVSRTAR